MPPLVTLHVQDRVEGTGGLGGNRRLAHARERAEGCEPSGHLAHAVGVQGCPPPVVARVEGGEHVSNLRASAFPQDEAVGAHAHRGTHQVGEGDAPSPLDVWLAFDEVDAVRVRGRDLGYLFDAHDPLARGNQREGRAQERRLSAAGGAGDENVGTGGDQGTHERTDGSREATPTLEVADPQAGRAEYPQRDKGSRARDGCQHRVHAHSAREGPVGDRAGVVQAHPARGRHADRQPRCLGRLGDPRVGAYEAASPVHPRLRAVDEHVGDRGVIQYRGQGEGHSALPRSQGVEGAGRLARAAPGAGGGCGGEGRGGAPGEESQRVTHE